MPHRLLDGPHRHSGLLAKKCPPSGWSHSTCMDAASWLRVVSVPATRMLKASMRSSAALSRSPASSMRMSSKADRRSGSSDAGRSYRRCSRRTGSRLEDDGLFCGEIAVEVDDLEDVLGPSRKTAASAHGRAQQRTDDRYRIRASNVGDEFTTARVDDAVDEFIDDCVDSLRAFARSPAV